MKRMVAPHTMQRVFDGHSDAAGIPIGRHHRFAERALAYALPVAAPAAGVEVTTLAGWVREELMRPSSAPEVVTP